MLLVIPPPPSSPLFPYTTLFRSELDGADALSWRSRSHPSAAPCAGAPAAAAPVRRCPCCQKRLARQGAAEDRKSTRLNSSHLGISYAVFCLKKKKRTNKTTTTEN